MRWFTRAVSICLLGIAAAHSGWAHGGVYTGPGTTLPPLGKPPSAGGPTGPGPPGPATPGPGKGTPGSTGPGAMPGLPGLGPSTGGGLAADMSSWQIWWWLNRAPYLNLKDALARQVVVTGSDAASMDGSSRRSEIGRMRTRMIAVLSEALPKSNAPDLTTAILLALGKAGSCLSDAEVAAVQETIAPLLRDPNQEVAETAAIALGALAHPAPALLLSEILEDSAAGRAAVGRAEVPYRTRAFAAYGLGLIGRRVQRLDVRRYVVRRLIRALESDHTGTNDIGVACLEALGLVHSDIDGPSDAKKGAAIAASSGGDSESAYLIQLFANRRQPDLLRAYAPVSLARSVSAGGSAQLDETIAALCPVLDPHAREVLLVQQSAVMALATLPAANEAQFKRIYSTLQDCALHGDRLASNLAMVSLARVSAGNTADAAGIETLLPVRAMFIREIGRGPTSTRAWAALALGIHESMLMARGGSPSSDARGAIRSALIDRRGPGEIGAYCVAAGLMHDTATREALVHLMLDGPDDDVRANAAIGLGLMQDEASLEPLRKVLADSRYRPVLLRDSAIALGLLGDVHAASQLWTMLAEAKSLGAQSAIASGLGFIGDARSIDPLLTLIGNKSASDRTRAFAAAALGNICDESRLPWNSPYALDVNYFLAPATLYEPTSGMGILDLL